jgi:hypothetical protein
MCVYSSTIWLNKNSCNYSKEGSLGIKIENENSCCFFRWLCLLPFFLLQSQSQSRTRRKWTRIELVNQSHIYITKIDKMITQAFFLSFSVLIHILVQSTKIQLKDCIFEVESFFFFCPMKPNRAKLRSAKTD